MAVGLGEEGKFSIFLRKRRILNDLLHAMVTFWFNSLETVSANIRVYSGRNIILGK